MEFKKRKKNKLKILGVFAVVLPLAILVPIAVAFALASDGSTKNNDAPVIAEEGAQTGKAENMSKPTEQPEVEDSSKTSDKDNVQSGDSPESSDKDHSSNSDKGSSEDHTKDNTKDNTKDSSNDSTKDNSESNDKDHSKGSTGDSSKNMWDYSSPLPENEPVGEEYFEDAIFIGNSQTEGFALYSGLSNIRAYFDKGVMVDTVFTKPSINKNGEKISIMEAVAADAEFSKAYIMLGMNELGWVSLDIFAEKYGKIIDTLREINPNAIIYVQSILPITKSKSDKDKIYNNKRINEFNEYIRAMCKEKEVYYLNVSEAVSDKNGALPEEAAFDGIHLNMKYCQKWLEYIKNHTITEDNQ